MFLILNLPGIVGDCNDIVVTQELLNMLARARNLLLLSTFMVVTVFYNELGGHRRLWKMHRLGALFFLFSLFKDDLLASIIIDRCT